MKRFKKVLALLLILTLCAAPMETQAAKKNVTASMKKNKYVRKIAKNISLYTNAEMQGRDSGKKKKEKISGYNALSIAGFVGYQNGKYQFTKKEIQRITYNLFGKKPKTSSIPSIESKKRKWIAKTPSSWSNVNKPYVYAGGDWGTYKPLYSISKVVKVKKNVYDVTIINKSGSWENDEVKVLGKTYIRIKKNSKSSYKYKITSLKYKRTYKGNDL